MLPLPPAHVRNSLIEDSSSPIQNDHVLILVFFAHFQAEREETWKES